MSSRPLTPEDAASDSVDQVVLGISGFFFFFFSRKENGLLEEHNGLVTEVKMLFFFTIIPLHISSR